MSHYAGLDVSLKETSICIVDLEGNIVREGKVFSEPAAITAFLQAAEVPLTRVGLEAGSLSPWLCHELLAAGWAVHCLETRHVKAALKAQTMKTDRNDARGLAHIMRTGWFRAVHVKSPESQKLRVLLNNRRCLLSKRLDIEADIRGSLKPFGLKLGTVTARSFDARVRELIAGDEMLEAAILPLLEVRDPLIQQCKKLEKIILGYVRADEVCRRFMTTPGVGALTALSFKTFLDRPERFAKSKDVGAALGLTPRKFASGEIDYDGHITKCGDDFVRAHLYEAAQTLLTRSKKWSSLKAWGLKIARRSRFQVACVAVARKLAIIMHRMWMDGTEFQWGQEPKAA